MMNRTLFMALLVMTGCAQLKTTNDDEIVTKRDRMYTGYGKFFGEDTLLFGGHDDLQKQPDVGIGVNTYLWRATLDTLSFMPLQTVDPFGGVIATDWYQDPDTPGERFKVNVRIMDRVLRADGLTITIFRERHKGGRWVTAPVASETSTNIENAILKKARQLKSSAR